MADRTVGAFELLLVAGFAYLLGESNSTSDLVVVGLLATPFVLLGLMYVVGVALERGPLAG